MRVTILGVDGLGTDREPASARRRRLPSGSTRSRRCPPRRDPGPGRPPSTTAGASRARSRRRPSRRAAPGRCRRRCGRPATSRSLPPTSAASAATGSIPPIMTPPGSTRAMRSGDPAALVGRRDRALQQAVVGPRARPCPRRRARRLARRRQGPRRRRASACCSTRRSPPASCRRRSTACCRPTRNMARCAMRSQVTPKTETAKINRIRLNMDRWRWLPRDLGQKYIIVNVPALPRHPGRKRRHALEAQGDRRRDQDPDAAADARWPPA